MFIGDNNVPGVKQNFIHEYASLPGFRNFGFAANIVQLDSAEAGCDWMLNKRLIPDTYGTDFMRQPICD